MDTCRTRAYLAGGSLPEAASRMPMTLWGICGNQDQSLTVVTQDGPPTLVPNLGFFPSGLAIDNARRYIHGSNTIGNSIAVYSTSKTLLFTITN